MCNWWGIWRTLFFCVEQGEGLIFSPNWLFLQDICTGFPAIWFLNGAASLGCFICSNWDVTVILKDLEAVCECSHLVCHQINRECSINRAIMIRLEWCLFWHVNTLLQRGSAEPLSETENISKSDTLNLQECLLFIFCFWCTLPQTNPPKWVLQF